MAAGSSSYTKGRALSGALEIALDRKMQTVTNTMESIQSLSAWCLENRKHHSMIVHYWIKWVRRSGVPHRLNLFYLANDVIQNCKRKNAIVYRESFAEVLTEAAALVKDPSISKSIERIFKIWEERGVYPEETITAFKSALNTGWGKRERSKSVRTKVAEKVVEVATINPKAALKSKIVAEFRPQALIEELLAYKLSVDQIDLKEKQLSTMRVDVCSSDTLKRLKDKAGGKKFSKDFEEASTKLEEFVAILDKQVKAGPAVTEALENAGVFYEAQYKEVKVVANAYTAFANRVSNLKKKLDQLKANLPDPEESPVPSPTMDAPSPTGSDSPFPEIEDDSLSPMLEIQKPIAKPVIDTRSKPAMENHNKPATVRAEPLAAHAAPVAASAEAIVVGTDLSAVRAEPAPVHLESTTVRVEPATVHSKPAVVHAEPASPHVDPARVHTQPVKVHTAPPAVCTEPAPVRTEPPTFHTSKPAVNSSRPAKEHVALPTATCVEPASVHHTGLASLHQTEFATVHQPEPPMDYCSEPEADNRNVEDMELSDVDEDSAEIIVEDGAKVKEVVSVSPPARTDIFLNMTPPISVATPPLPKSLRSQSLTPPSPPPSPSPSPPPSPPLDSPPLSPTECIVTPPAAPSTPTPPISAPPPSSVAAPITPGRAFTAATVSSSPSVSLPNLANVDLAKISSILSSLTSVMKHTGVSPAARPSPGTPTTPTTSGLKNQPQGSAPVAQVPLGNTLSKVEITQEKILSAISKTHPSPQSGLQGSSSSFNNVPGSTTLSSIAPSQSSSSPTNTTVSSMKDKSVPSNTQPFLPKGFGFSPNSSTSEVSSTSVSKASVEHSPALLSSNCKPSSNTVEFASIPPSSTENTMSQSSEQSATKIESAPSSPTSLEMKIHNFLKGNPSFSGLNLNIPILGNLPPGNAAPESQSNDFLTGPTSTSIDNVDGTPVRDERSGTPTQDEMMDKPTSSNVDTMSLLSKIMSPGSSASSTRSPLPIRDEDYRELSNSLASYRSFSLGVSSPTVYRPPLDNMELPSSILGSPAEHFYPDTSFQEDEDYRDYEYSGPPPSVTLSLENPPPASILTSSKLLDSEEYQPIQTSYSHRSQEFGMQSVFPPSVRSIVDQGDSCSRLSASPELYGNYSMGGNEGGSGGSPSPSSKDPFFTPDSNHNSFPQSILNSVLPQTQFPDSAHSVPPRQHFSSLSTHATTTSIPPVSGVESPLVSSISATSTIEFKNMLKNASRKSSDDKQFVQNSKSSPNEGQNLLSQTGMSPEKQQLQEEHYRIETRVSSSCLDLPDSTEDKGAPIQTLGYPTSNRLSGEPIQTVESIRVLGKGNRGSERDGGRVGWFEMNSTGSSFDNGPSADLEQTSLGGNIGVSAFSTQYKEHVPEFQDNVNNFRTNNFNPLFEPRIPPPIAPLFEKDLHSLREQAGPPGPPPGPSVDHGSLFPRDHPISLLPPMEHSNLFTKENSAPLPMTHGAPPLPPDHGGCPFPVPPPLPPLPELGGIPFPAPPPPPPLPVEHGGLPFSPPLLLDRGGVPFPKDHGSVPHGAMKEHYNINVGPPRDLMAMPQRDHNGPPRTRENLGMPIHSREHHGPPPCNYPPPLLGPPHRDNLHQNRMMMRDPRQDFRPRDPFHSLKRPRPPFPRGPPFFAPKRPFYPPRY
ncbi:regulation of nuclear pre-mRNA domain-containing protein 2 [Ambystoma mexicanum]|uniref:regulation of nuclear pre-mRNA domain-containing protein 2 n=1 Tax=Ambystoma mexicanum TaxID=8296 RepID=UPI0037E8934B